MSQVDLSEQGALERALEEQLAVIYKHSPYCPTSRMAMHQIRQFVARHPDVPVYVVDVVRERELARQLARDLDIRHQSPQVIVLRNGSPTDHASHYDVTLDRLESWTT